MRTSLRVILALAFLGALSGPAAESASAGGFVLGDQTKLLGFLPVGGRNAGHSVAIDGDTAVAGSPADGFFPFGPFPGTARVFGRDVGGIDNWGSIKALVPSGGSPDDKAGWSVAVSGDVAVVGAIWDDDAGDRSGSVFLFERNLGGSDNWGQVKELAPSDASAGIQFGYSVTIDGDTIVASAPAGAGPGAAYVFVQDEGGVDNWGEVTKITASDGVAGDFFGGSVSIRGDRVVVGARRDDDGGDSSGAAYVFERDLGGVDNWGERTKLVASDAEEDDLFGTSVSISGDHAIIGAPGADGGAQGSRGAAYVFERNSGGADAWGEVRILTASDVQYGNVFVFGRAVAIEGDLAVVGAADNDRTSGAGAAYAFQRNEGGTDNWGETDKMTAADAGAEGDRFGASVGLGGGMAIVGTPGDDVGPSFNPSRSVGSAYIFDTDDACSTGPSVCPGNWEKASLLIRENKPGKEKLIAKLFKGPAITQADLGNTLVTNGTGYSTCIFDDGGTLIAKLRVERWDGLCADKECWAAVAGLPPNGLGYRYKDKKTSAHGLSSVVLKGAGSGKSKFVIKAKNNAAKQYPRLPTGLAAALQGTTSVTLEVHVDDPAQCYAAVLPNITQSTSEIFKASK